MQKSLSLQKVLSATASQIINLQALRCRHIITDGTAMQLLGNQSLSFLAGNKVDELLGIFHVLGILDDIDAVRLGNNAFLHVNQLDRGTISHILGTALLEGQSHSVLTISHALVHGRGTGQELLPQQN